MKGLTMLGIRRRARAIQNWAADPERHDERRQAALRVAAEGFQFQRVEMRERLAAVLDAVRER
jgi:hypothetical protein